MRPVLVGVPAGGRCFCGRLSLAIARPEGWLPPFLAFGVVLVGLVWFEVWAIRHRHDDE